MSSNVSVKLTWNKQALGTIDRNTMSGIFKMGFDMADQARQLAPYLTGALRNTIRVQEIGDNIVEVKAGGTYGGKKVDYAWIREQGPNKNPATEHYMRNAMNIIMSGDYMKKYFGEITR